MVEVFSGDISIKAALADDLLQLDGLPKLTRNA
jgi:hypothetical protein